MLLPSFAKIEIYLSRMVWLLINCKMWPHIKYSSKYVSVVLSIYNFCWMISVDVAGICGN